MNDDRELVISQLDQMQANQNQLRDDREEMRRRLEQFESESGLIRREVGEKESEIDQLRGELGKMTQNLAGYQKLTEQCHQLKDELENVRDLYRDAQDEINHLSQFKLGLTKFFWPYSVLSVISGYFLLFLCYFTFSLRPSQFGFD